MSIGNDFSGFALDRGSTLRYRSDRTGLSVRIEHDEIRDIAHVRAEGMGRVGSISMEQMRRMNPEQIVAMVEVMLVNVTPGKNVQGVIDRLVEICKERVA